jgi:hypothetical protein
LQDEEKTKGAGDRLELPLKNGAGQMDVSWARIFQESLRHLLERHPEHFHALRALSEGRNEEVSKEHLRDLKRWDFVLKDGSPNPTFKAVMSAAYRETPDGSAIVDPVEVKTPENAAALQQFDTRAEKQYAKSLKRLLRRFLEDDMGEGKGRS